MVPSCKRFRYSDPDSLYDAVYIVQHQFNSRFVSLWISLRPSRPSEMRGLFFPLCPAYFTFCASWHPFEDINCGTRDVSVARRLLLIHSVRPHGTQESPWTLCCLPLWPSSLVRFAHCRPSPCLPLGKQAFSVIHADVRSLRAWLDVYKRKKHSVLLYFLVAGPRIELGTS